MRASEPLAPNISTESDVATANADVEKLQVCFHFLNYVNSSFVTPIITNPYIRMLSLWP